MNNIRTPCRLFSRQPRRAAVTSEDQTKGTQIIYRYTILYVDNVAETLVFFERAFGFERGFLHEAGDYGELITGTTKLAFSSAELMRQLGKTPTAPKPDAPSFELAFEVPDVPAALKQAVAAGATLIQDAQQQPWGQVTSYVSDPNGFLIEICSPVDA